MGLSPALGPVSVFILPGKVSLGGPSFNRIRFNQSKYAELQITEM